MVKLIHTNELYEYSELVNMWKSNVRTFLNLLDHGLSLSFDILMRKVVAFNFFTVSYDYYAKYYIKIVFC